MSAARPNSSSGDVFVDRERSSPAQPQAKHAPPPMHEHPTMSYGGASSAAAASASQQAQAWAPQQPAATSAYHPADEAARRAFEQHMQRFYQQQQQQQPPQPQHLYPPPPFSPQHAYAAAAAAGYPAPPVAMPPTPLSFDPLRMQQWMQHSHAAGGMMPGAAPAWNGGMAAQMPLPLPLPLPMPHPSDPFAAYAAHANGVGAAAGYAPPPSFDVEAELLFLSKIERKARSLQAKGHHLMAVELLEQSVASRKMLYGELSDEVRVAAEQLSLVYNSLAMASLYKEEYKTALRLLRKAELLTTHMSELTSVRVQTLNNLACCYRRLARPKTALNLLRESLVLLGTEKGTEGRPVTHLNMCAILSQLGRHDEAIEHAKAAVMHCQKQLLTHPQPSSAGDHSHQQQHSDEGSESDSRSDSDDGSHSDSSARPSRRSHRSRRSASGSSTAAAAALSLSHQQLSEKIVILSIAYHNLGVEEEFLLRFDRALHWYSKALQLALEQIGEAEEITQTFKRSLTAARKQVEERHKVQQKAEAVTKAAAAEAARSASASNTGRTHSRPASATSARSASASRSSRPASAASSRAPPPPVPHQYASTGRARPSSAHHSSRSSAAAPANNVPSYASATNGSSARVRPKSASVSRPPRPGR